MRTARTNTILAPLLILFAFATASAWHNGGPTMKLNGIRFGGHDWIAKEGYRLVATNPKLSFIAKNKDAFLIGTEAPDSDKLPDIEGEHGYGDSLHNTPCAYWCPRCWSFTLDCSHLVKPLDAPSVTLNNWQINSVAYDRGRRILEIEMNTRERYQRYGVPREVAIGLVKSAKPAQFEKENIDGKFGFARVRTQQPRFTTGTS